MRLIVKWNIRKAISNYLTVAVSENKMDYTNTNKSKRNILTERF